LDLIAGRSALNTFDQGTGKMVEGHRVAYKAAMRSGSFDPVGDVFGAVLGNTSFADSRGPGVASPGCIHQSQHGKQNREWFLDRISHGRNPPGLEKVKRGPPEHRGLSVKLDTTCMPKLHLF
jgi:hypothetical protein